jgi:GTPase
LDKSTITTRRKALEKASGGPVMVISGVAGLGLQDTLRAIYAQIEEGTPKEEAAPWQP